MISNILNYFTIGLIFGLFIEFARTRAENHPSFPEELKDGWNTTHRILTVVIWPYALIMFIYGIINRRK